MQARTLHGGDKQTVIGVAGQDVSLATGAVFEGGDPAGEIEHGPRQCAIVTAKTLLLKHRFDLGEEIVIGLALAAGGERTRNDEQDGEKKKQLHEDIIAIENRRAMSGLRSYGLKLATHLSDYPL